MDEEREIEEVVELITHFFSVTRRKSFERWQKLKLTMPQMKVLMLIACKGEVPVGKLAEVMGVKASNITFILDQLETKGLIARKSDRSDRRVVLGSLTDRGRKILEQSGKEWKDYWKTVLANLNWEELGKVKEGLKIILNRLKEEGEQ
jgi:DNA-binding MarR family transcriptional regulator